MRGIRSELHSYRISIRQLRKLAGGECEGERGAIKAYLGTRVKLPRLACRWIDTDLHYRKFVASREAVNTGERDQVALRSGYYAHNRVVRLRMRHAGNIGRRRGRRGGLGA